jgi:hypothetical protein
MMTLWYNNVAAINNLFTAYREHIRRPSFANAMHEFFRCCCFSSFQRLFLNILLGSDSNWLCTFNLELRHSWLHSSHNYLEHNSNYNFINCWLRVVHAADLNANFGIHSARGRHLHASKWFINSQQPHRCANLIWLKIQSFSLMQSD